MTRPALAAALAAALAFAPIARAGADAISFRSDGKAEEVADALLEAMTDEEVLAQTFMLGWVGADPSPLIIEWIEKRRIGGVKIFGWNTEDTVRLAKSVGDLQGSVVNGALAVPLLVATDQEGGWIRHVKGDTSETPGNMAIGASGYPRDAYLSGYYIGREIAALGVNMNFAPTVDLFTDRRSELIGPRAFGDDPVKVATLGAAFAKGLERAGIIATAKHFPGHGATELDSHGILPEIDADEKTLWERELVPYRMLARERIPAIMSGHLAFPRTPARYDPASLSRWFLVDVLRDKIGFQGVIITDDLLMNGAAASAGSLSRAAKRALEAGNDIVMLSKTPELDDPVWTSLLDAYRHEKKFRSRVRDAARRVLLMKLDRLRSPLAPPLVPDPATVRARVPDPEGKAFFLDLAARSATVIRNSSGVLPLRAADAGRMLLAGQFDDFLTVGRAAFPSAETYKLSYAPGAETSAAEKAELVRRAKTADSVILCLANSSSLAALQALRPLGKRIIVLSVLSPALLDEVPWAASSVAVYSYSRESFIAGISAISGVLKAEGILPFPLDAPRPVAPSRAAAPRG